ncbi:MAG: phosphoribosylamine--glycine ligase [Flavobacteriales bacterium]|nr:MAG: phosphoribosylamine--glycine ligase [Flavobacteriales bacterium]
MNVLIIGSGGREHVFAWKIAQSPKLNQLFVAQGNAGTANCGTNVNIAVNDFDAIKNFVLENNISLVVVGPEDPLVNGIHDYFLADDAVKNVQVIGPQKEAAKLEGSKEFAKLFMLRHGIPTAKHASFVKENIDDGFAFLETLHPPYVLKADGLAAGKGVLILENLEKAKNELREMLESEKFGSASSKVVIEEFLDGIELSVFVLTDGNSYKILPEAKDYKRIGEGDTGLNTGGMGAISPVPFADAEFMQKVEDSIVKPTIEGLQKDGIPYKGFVFIGLMNVDGNPYVIEYNVRMGDPECEVVIPRIKSDFLELLEGVANGNLFEKTFEIDERSVATVMLVSGGYPEAYEKGKVMSGLGDVQNSILFHAGTKQDGEDIVTNGGRVIAITSYGNDFEGALNQSYANAKKITFEEKYYRKDLGFDLKGKEKVTS